MTDDIAPPDPSPEQEPPRVDEDPDALVEVPTNWEFIGEPPTVEAVELLLTSLDDQWGVPPVAFKDFVQALPTRKKVKVEREVGTGERRRVQSVEEWVDVWTLYMSVAGRIAMLNACAEVNHWRVDLGPSLTGVNDLPIGFIEHGHTNEEFLVYREECTIFVVGSSTGDQGTPLGTKTGTAWVKARGGQQAAGSNPYEKVETSARGRAIGGWGIGILPGSGVASVEEMMNRTNLTPSQNQTPSGPRKSREAMIEEAQGLVEKVRDLRDDDHATSQEKLIEFAHRVYKHDVSTGGDEPEVDWSKWRDGQLPLLIQTLDETRRKLLGDDAPV